MDWNATVYGPQYDVFGIAAILTVGPVASEVVVIDGTTGVEISAGPAMLGDIKPVAFMRKACLRKLGYEPQECHGGTLLMNGTTWLIKNTRPKPGPDGAGEWLFILERSP